MSRTRKPAFRVEATTETIVHLEPFAWNSRDYGRPTAENLAKFVAKYNESFQPGGVNEQCGVESTIVHAVLIRQEDGSPVATWVDEVAFERMVAARKAVQA